MKNTLQYSCLLILLAVVMLFSACQPTPDDPIIISKNDGTLDDKLNNSSVESFLEELPSHLEDEFPGKADDVTIKISADIDIPSSIDKIPVKEYDVREVDAALIQQVADFFMEGKTMYEPQYQMTKAELKEEMKEVEEVLDENRLQEEYGDNEEIKDMIREIQTMRYSILQSFYEEAPDEIEKVEAVIEFKPTKAYLNQAEYADKYASASYFAKLGDKSGQRALEELEAFYTVGSEEQVRFEALAELDNGYTGSIVAMNGTKDNNYNNHDYYNSITFYRCSQTDSYGRPFDIFSLDYPQQPLTITQEQAQEITDSAMEELGFADDYIISYNERISEDEGQAEHYLIEYAREAVPGLEVVNYFYPQNTTREGQDQLKENAVRPVYGYETIKFYVVDDGIAQFSMFDPLKEVGVVNESVGLIDFDSIYTIFKTHASIKYDGLLRDVALDENGMPIINYDTGLYEEVLVKADETTVEYTEVTFKTLRIVKKDDVMSYLIVPVWIFSGNQKSVHVERDLDNNKYTDIIINAIDGTIISDADCY